MKPQRELYETLNIVIHHLEQVKLFLYNPKEVFPINRKAVVHHTSKARKYLSVKNINRLLTESEAGK